MYYTGGGMRNPYCILVGKPEEKRSGLVILKWVLRKCEVVDGIYLAHDRDKL